MSTKKVPMLRKAVIVAIADAQERLAKLTVAAEESDTDTIQHVATQLADVGRSVLNVGLNADAHAARVSAGLAGDAKPGAYLH